MKNEIMQCIVSVINALNNVSVKGEQNLANLSGSITVLREVAEMVAAAKIEEETKDEEVK
jgi:hypothetical protein